MNLGKAEEICNREIYRNKPEEHFDEIFDKSGGIMEPIRKDKR